jgi:hypothetical protein
MKDCDTRNDKEQKDYERRLDAWNGVGREPLVPFISDCWWRIPQQTRQRYDSYARETLVDTYWRVGYLKIAAFCVLPPVAGCLLILVSISMARWLIRGFKG